MTRFILIATMLLGLQSQVSAQNDLLNPESLKGISSIHFNQQIEFDGVVAPRLGFREGDVASDALSAIAASRIANRADSLATLRLTVELRDTESLQRSTAIGTVQVAVLQEVRLTRDTDVVFRVPTHSRSVRYLGTVDLFNRHFRGEVERLTRKVLADIHEANPDDIAGHTEADVGPGIADRPVHHSRAHESPQIGPNQFLASAVSKAMEVARASAEVSRGEGEVNPATAALGEARNPSSQLVLNHPATLVGIRAVKLVASLELDDSVRSAVGFQQSDVEQEVARVLRTAGIAVSDASPTILRVTAELSDVSSLTNATAVGMIRISVCQRVEYGHRRMTLVLPTHERTARFAGSVRLFDERFLTRVQNAAHDMTVDLKRANAPPTPSIARNSVIHSEDLL